MDSSKGIYQSGEAIERVGMLAKRPLPQLGVEHNGSSEARWHDPRTQR